MDKVRAIFQGRPFYMNATMVFCAYMTFIYMPFDMFYKPVDQDEEVWFGYVLHGWAAKATEPIHWAIYGAGFYGFLKMKSWMWPWAGLYTVQVAIGMFVWNMIDERGGGVTGGVISAVPFFLLAWAFLKQRERFQPTAQAPVYSVSDLTEEDIQRNTITRLFDAGYANS